MENINEILKLRKKLGDLHFEGWMNDVVFTFQWWFIIITIILPWVIWWNVVDRSRLKNILIVGLLVIIISLLLDGIGTSLRLWIYPYTLLPLEREIFDPADLAILPMFFMLTYQFFTNWKSYLIASTVFAFFGAYIGGNIYEILGIYKILKWKHIYSVPIYLLISIIVKAIVEKVNKEHVK
jgi:hypothetical protein